MEFSPEVPLALADSNLCSDTQNTISDFYPVNRRDAAPVENMAVNTASRESGMSGTPLSLDEEALLPGQAYAVYNTLDLLGVLPQDYEALVKRAAHWAGVDHDYVCSVVEYYERRLLRSWKRTDKEAHTNG